MLGVASDGFWGLDFGGVERDLFAVQGPLSRGGNRILRSFYNFRRVYFQHVLFLTFILRNYLTKDVTKGQQLFGNRFHNELFNILQVSVRRVSGVWGGSPRS